MKQYVAAVVLRLHVPVKPEFRDNAPHGDVGQYTRCVLPDGATGAVALHFLDADSDVEARGKVWGMVDRTIGDVSAIQVKPLQIQLTDVDRENLEILSSFRDSLRRHKFVDEDGCLNQRFMDFVVATPASKKRKRKLARKKG